MIKAKACSLRERIRALADACIPLENLRGASVEGLRGGSRALVDRFSECLTVLGEDEREPFFWLNNGGSTPVSGLGCVIELTPALFADEATAAGLERLVAGPWPAGTTAAVSLYASPRVEALLADYVHAHEGGSSLLTHEARDVLAAMAKNRASFFARRATDVAGTSRTVRHFRVWLSITLETGEMRAHEAMRRRALGTKSENGSSDAADVFMAAAHNAASTLMQFGLFAGFWDRTTLTRTVRELVNLQALAAGPEAHASLDAPNGYALLRDGIVFPDTVVDIEKDRIRFSSVPENGRNTLEAVSLGITAYPAATHMNRMREVMGALANDGAVLSRPFLMTAVMEPGDIVRDRATLAVKHARARQLAGTEIGQFLTDLAERERDLAVGHKACEEGRGLARLAHAVIVWARPGEAGAAAQNVKNVLARLGMDAHVDAGLQLMGLIAALPMQASQSLMRDAKTARRSMTVTVEAAAHLMPFFGDWRGTGVRSGKERATPLLLLTSRRGELFGVDFFANRNGNFNALVVGTSGSGKSVLAQETVLSMLATGARVWVFDIGRSYQNCVDLTEGQFIDFSTDEKESRLCLNPLDMLEDPADMLDELAQIIIAMANGEAPMELTQAELLKVAIERCVREARNAGRTPTVTDLTLLLMREGDPGLKDTALRLMPYAAGGRFSHWFEGKAAIDFSRPLVVLEMEALSSKPVLQNVVLLTLIMRILQDIRSMPRSARKLIVIDEAWRLLTGNSGRFIEWACRTLRKYGAGIMCISQSMEDFQANPTARAVRQNADSVFLLRQKRESIAAYTEDANLRHVLSGLTTRAEEFSEVYVRIGDGAGVVGRLTLDAFSMTAYSTKAEVFEAVRKARAQGLDIAAAVEKAARGAR